MLAVTTTMYDEPVASKRLYQCIRHYNLPWIISYGAFLEYGEREHNESYLNDFKHTIILKHKPIQEQCVKEQLCHAVGRLGYDWELVIGSDEWFTGSVEDMLYHARSLIKNPNEPHIFHIRHLEHNPDTEQQLRYMRLFYKPHLLTVRGNHWTHFYKNRILKPVEGIISGIVIHQDDRIRDRPRNGSMNDYQKKRIVKEWALSNYMIVNNFAETKLSKDKLSEIYPVYEIQQIRPDMFFVKNGQRPDILTPFWNFYPVSDGIYIEQKNIQKTNKVIFDVCINEGKRLAEARNLT